MWDDKFVARGVAGLDDEPRSGRSKGINGASILAAIIEVPLRQLAVTRCLTRLLGQPAGAGELSWLRRDGQALGFARGGLQCWVAFGAPLRLPAGEVLLASAPVTDGLLPADATAWLRA